MITSKQFFRAVLGAGFLGLASLAPQAGAQTVDDLLDKLVEKNVLSLKEANELRARSDEGFKKAMQAKTGMPDWVNQLKIYGDVRGRFDKTYTENREPLVQNTDRNRYRYRLRVGMTATMKDNFEAGFRLTSGDPSGSFGGNAVSGNSTAQDNGSKKGIYVDQAYGKWTPIRTGPWLVSATIGKMENPFLNSDMVWDADYTPEGAAIQVSYGITKEQTVKLNSGLFILDEFNQGPGASHDPILAGVQGRWDAKWSKKISTTAGLAYYSISDEENLGNTTTQNNNSGNTRDVFGNLVANFNSIVADAAFTYNLETFPQYPGEFPIKIWADYINNVSAKKRNDGYTMGVTFGKAGKKGAWEVGYRFERLEADAWYEELVNDDFGAFAQNAPLNSGLTGGYRAGTNVRGHIAKASYSPADAFTLSVSYYFTELVHTIPAGSESQTGRLLVDATWKF